jgi:hypothetical protein
MNEAWSDKDLRSLQPSAAAFAHVFCSRSSLCYVQFCLPIVYASVASEMGNVIAA